MSCQLHLWNQPCPQSSILPIGPWKLGGQPTQSGGETGVQSWLCNPQPCAEAQWHTRGAYCMPKEGWRWRPCKAGGRARGRVWAPLPAKDELLPGNLESTASLLKEGAQQKGAPRVQMAQGPVLGYPAPRTSADRPERLPGEAGRASSRKSAERTESCLFIDTLPKFAECRPMRAGSLTQGRGFPAPHASPGKQAQESRFW